MSAGRRRKSLAGRAPFPAALSISLLSALLLALVLAGCSAGSKSWRKGGTAGTKPYTVHGKTYYPLKSAHGFVEEGVASWYGPGFHGKTTANGETYNQYALTAAHKLLPLGTRVRVTHLGNGRSVLVRVNDRGPFVDDRVIDLSKSAAMRLGMLGKGTARVRVQSLGDIPQIDKGGSLAGKFFIQLGAFGKKENARRLTDILAKSGHSGRLVFGSNNMWNVQAGPWGSSSEAQAALAVFRALYPQAFVIGGDK